MREAGFYWVSSEGHWGVAYWSAMEGLWFEPGLDSGFSDEEMDKIDERRIVRGM